MFIAKQKKLEELNETLFYRSYCYGESMSNGKVAETNYVWPSGWLLSNYHYHYYKTVDLAFHRRLHKAIAKGLYPILDQGWYASEGQPFSKRYQDLTTLLAIPTYKHLSRIKQQLDPSQKELQREYFLAKWEYRKSANGSDYVITYYPGEKFFQDQQARLARRQLAEQIASGKPRELPAPQLSPPKSEHLLADILEVCGDRQNQAAYFKLIQEYSEGLIRMALSETRQANREGRIRKSKGAYFTDILKRLAPQG